MAAAVGLQRWQLLSYKHIGKAAFGREQHSSRRIRLYVYHMLSAESCSVVSKIQKEKQDFGVMHPVDSLLPLGTAWIQLHALGRRCNS